VGLGNAGGSAIGKAGVKGGGLGGKQSALVGIMQTLNQRSYASS
jgi:hypothetical protein